MDNKTSYRIERVFKGVANHWRVRILTIIARHDGIFLDDICDKLKCNVKTTSEHTRRLRIAGLINKHHEGSSVGHNLTPYGKKMLKVLKLFSNSQEFEN